jgi:hypothetical protein
MRVHTTGRMCIITGLAAKRSVQRDKPSKSRGEAFLKMEHAKYSVAFLASYTLGGLKFPQVAGTQIFATGEEQR